MSTNSSSINGIPPAISTVFAQMSRLAPGKEKTPTETQEIAEKVCNEALKILADAPIHTSQGELFETLKTSLKPFELTLDQKKKLYSVLLKSPLSDAMTNKLEQGEITCEDFLDIYTLELQDGPVKLSWAELSCLGAYFKGFSKSGMRDAVAKSISLDLKIQQFDYFRTCISGECAYDLRRPDIWKHVTILAARFVLDLGKAFPSFPRFGSVNDAVQFVTDPHFTELDLSQFGDEITNDDLIEIAALSQGKQAPLSHLKKLVVRSNQVTAAGLSELPATMHTQNLPTYPNTITAAQWANPAAFLATLPPMPKELVEFLDDPCPFDLGKTNRETHIVFPLIKNITTIENGVAVTKPRTVATLDQLDKDSGGVGCRYIWSEILKPEVDKPAAAKFDWGVMTKDPLPGSRNKSFAQQEQIARDLGYIVPGVRDAATFILGAHRHLWIRLYSDNPWTYTRCQEKVDGYHLVVGGFASGGLDVCLSGYDLEYIGLAGLRKF